MKAYYEDLIKELDVTLDTQSEVKHADINVLEEKLASTINKFESAVSNSSDTEKESLISHVGQIKAILDKFQCIAVEVNQQIEHHQIHHSADKAGDDLIMISESERYDLSVDMELLLTEDKEVMDIIYTNTHRSGDIDLVKGWKKTYAFLRNNIGEKVKFLRIDDIIHGLNQFSRFAPVKWQHIYEWATSYFLQQILLVEGDHKAPEAAISAEKFISILSNANLKCVKGIMYDIVNTTKRIIRIERRNSSDKFTSNHNVNSRLYKQLQYNFQLTRRTNIAILMTYVILGNKTAEEKRNRLVSFLHGIPDLFVDNVSIDSSKVLKQKLSPGKTKLKKTMSKTFDKSKRLRKLIAELKVTLRLKRFIGDAELQSKRNELSFVKSSNERYDAVDRQFRKNMYETLSEKTREDYENQLHRLESEVDTFSRDLDNMMIGIEEEIAVKVKDDHTRKTAALNQNVREIELDDLRMKEHLEKERERVQRLEFQVREEFLKLEGKLDRKKKSEVDRDLDRGMLTDLWEFMEATPQQQFDFLEHVVNRAPSFHRFHPLMALWMNEEEKLKAKYAPRSQPDTSMSGIGNMASSNPRSNITKGMRRRSMW